MYITSLFKFKYIKDALSVAINLGWNIMNILTILDINALDFLKPFYIFRLNGIKI